MPYIALDTYLGPRDAAPIDPAGMAFTVKPAKTCRSCLFARQLSDICELACCVAKLRGMPHCDAGYVYVAAPVAADPRQLPIPIAGA